MAQAGAPPRYLLDRGLGSRIVPGLLRVAGWQLSTMDGRYGIERSQAIADIAWIEDATGRGEARNRLGAEAVYRLNARVFALANANLAGPEAARCFLAHEASIVRMATRAPGPYVVSVTAAGLRRRRLNLDR